MAKITKTHEGTSPLTDEQLVLIGRIAVGFTLVESTAIGIASRLTTPVQPLGLLAVSGGRFDELVQRIRDLNVFAVNDVGLNLAIKEWTQRALREQRKRNRVLHTPWFVEPSLQSLLGVRTGRRSRTPIEISRLTNRELMAMAHSIEATAYEGLELLGQVNRLPTARAWS